MAPSAAYRELIQKKADLEAELEGLRTTIQEEGRGLTEEERERKDEIMAELPGLADDLRFAEASRDAERVEQVAETDEALAIEMANDGREITPRAPKVFRSLGEQLQAIAASTRGDFGQTNRLNAVAQGAGESIDSDGGFLLEDTFATGIERRMHEVGNLLPLFSPLTISGGKLVTRMIDESSRANGSRWGTVQGYWLDEGDSITASRPKFRRLTNELYKVGALGYATSELLEDAPAMTSVYTEAFAEELTFMVEDAIVEGDGSGKPLGFRNAANGGLVSVAKETSQPADTIVTANLTNMWARLPARMRGNAIWLYNQDCEPELDELTIPAGTAAVAPRFVTYDTTGVLRIRGREARAVEYMETLGDQGDIALVAPQGYQLIRHTSGINQATSMHVRFANDEMTFRATGRWGGSPKWNVALTPFKGTATQSPFVVIDARA